MPKYMVSDSYTLDNAWEQARRRLRLLEACYDASTTRRLRALGVGSGWRCLEVGAGGGSIAGWLCSEVGPEGRVLAVDLDTRFVEEIEADNLDVLRFDVATGGLPRDAFDLVHARAVLMHLPQRERVLDTLVASLRPGGWLLVEEGDCYPLQALGSGLHGEVWEMVIAGFGRAGVDFTWARHLPGLLHDRRLDDVGAESDVFHVEGASPAAELFRLTVTQVRELGLLPEATPGQLDAWDALLREPGRWFPSCAIVAAWGRRPG